MTRALFDGDIIAYAAASVTDGKRYNITLPDGTVISERKKVDISRQCLHHGIEMDAITISYEPDPESHACFIVKQQMERLIDGLDINDAVIYLSSHQNHRYLVDPNYKANRLNVRRPANLGATKEYLAQVWGATEMDNLECDDVLGILQTEGNRIGKFNPPDCKTLICTIDKDLNMIPGWHYNWQKDSLYWMDPVDSLRCFYTQLITGDTTDNIPGLSEKAPKKRKFPTKPLEGMTTEDEMYRYVLGGYQNKYGSQLAEAEMHKNGNLLWILQDRDTYWRTV